jgi:hypothetical protein
VQLSITGDDVAAALWSALWDSTLIPMLPSLVGTLTERGPDAEPIVTRIIESGVSLLTEYPSD